MEIVKEISLCTSFSPGKPPYLAKGPRAPGRPGHWIIKWPNMVSPKEKIIAREFYIDKVKANSPLLDTFQ